MWKNSTGLMETEESGDISECSSLLAIPFTLALFGTLAQPVDQSNCVLCPQS